MDFTAEQLAGMAKQIAPVLVPAVAEGVRKQLVVDAQANARTAEPPAGEKDAPEAHDVQVGKPAVKGTGLGLVRWAKAMAVAKMTGNSPEVVARGWGYDDIARRMVDHRKALSQGVFAAGGSTVHPEYAQEFIELLRNAATFRKAGPRSFPMGASIVFDRQAGAGTATYGPEAVDIAESAQATEQLKMSEKKLLALTPVSNDLIRNASISAEEFVREDLITVVGLREDLAFLRGTGTEYEPRGIRNWIASANAYTETITTAGAPTLAEIKKELRKAIKTLKKSNVPLRKPVWFFSPGVEETILSATGPGGVGSNQYEVEMSERGTLCGYPYFVTNQIPSNLASKSRTEIYLVDMSEVLLGESMSLELEVFPNGSYYSGSAVVSGISRDQTVIRAIEKHDLGMRHTVSGVVITNSSWDGGTA